MLTDIALLLNLAFVLRLLVGVAARSRDPVRHVGRDLNGSDGRAQPCQNVGRKTASWQPHVF
jgi:hypothetical protein